MNKLTKNLITLMGLIFTLLQFSCDFQEKDTIEQQPIKFSFEAPEPSFSNERKLLKNEDVAAVVVSIKDSKKKSVVTSKKLSLFDFNGKYISEPLSLVPGNYFLYEFMVIDRNNKVLFATPVEGSDKSHLVLNPLEIEIYVSKDGVEQVTPEVLAINESTPKEFGYTSFSFTEIETFEFPIAVFVYDEQKEKLVHASSKISIFDITKEFSFSSELTAETNWVTLPKQYSNYSLKVQKPGYQSYLHDFKSSDLQGYNAKENPLIIILKSEQGKLVFWNKLGSDEEVLNSKVGPNLELFYDENNPVNREYVPGVEGKAITMAPNDLNPPTFVMVPNLILNDLPSLIDPEQGTIECFYYQTREPSFDSAESNHIFDGGSGLGSGMGFENFGAGDQPEEDENFAWTKLVFFLTFEGKRVSVSFPNLKYDYNAKWVHLAAVWDRSGIDGSQETIQLFINGKKVDATTETGWGTEVGDQADIAGGHSDWWNSKKPFYIDELKIYDYAKTNF